MSFNGDELNYLIYRYLLESGFMHTAFAFESESQVNSSNINGSHVPVAALLRMIQKGLNFTEGQIGVDENGNQRNIESLTLIDAVSKYTPQKSPSKNDSSNSNLKSNTSSKTDSSIKKPSKYILPAPSRIMTRAARLSLEKKLNANEKQKESNLSSSSPLVIKTEGKVQLPLTSISSNVPRSANLSPRQAPKPDVLEPNTKPLNNQKTVKTPPRSVANQEYFFNPGSNSPSASKPIHSTPCSTYNPIKSLKPVHSTPSSSYNPIKSLKPVHSTPSSTYNPIKSLKPDQKLTNTRKTVITHSRSIADQDELFKPDTNSPSASKPIHSKPSLNGLKINMGLIGLDRLDVIKVKEPKCFETKK